MWEKVRLWLQAIGVVLWRRALWIAGSVLVLVGMVNEDVPLMVFGAWLSLGDQLEEIRKMIKGGEDVTKALRSRLRRIP
jgi:hypothetical protein